MLKSLEIRGYRGFSSYRMSDLARVNLVVGKNNCGKTSVLEAIEVLVSGGNPMVINRLGTRRQKAGSQYGSRIPGSWALDFSHVFHGHSFDVGSSFHLGSNDGTRWVTVEVVAFDEADEEFHLQNSEQEEDNAPDFAFVLKIDSSVLNESITLPMQEDGSVVFAGHRAAMRDRFSGLPARFLTVDSFDPAKMGESWNTALANSEVCIQKVAPSLDRAVCLKGEEVKAAIEQDIEVR